MSQIEIHVPFERQSEGNLALPVVRASISAGRKRLARIREIGVEESRAADKGRFDPRLIDHVYQRSALAGGAQIGCDDGGRAQHDLAADHICG